MKRQILSQEMLKLIACVTMLIDHIAAALYPTVLRMDYQTYILMRVIGRIAFPIYCFLMAEGSYYTKNPSKYAFRLAVGALLSEIPFDLCFKRGLTWTDQSVMITLLLGFIALELFKRFENDWVRIAISGVLFLAADKAGTDYGGYGVLLVILFGQARGNLTLQTILLAMVTFLMNSMRIQVLQFTVPIETFAVLAMIPIAFYSGKKTSSSKVLQWAFYLFYPVHITLLYLIRTFLH